MSVTTETNEDLEPARPVPWHREVRKAVMTAAACAVFLAGMATAETITGLYAIAVALWVAAAIYATVAGFGAALLPRSRGDRS